MPRTAGVLLLGIGWAIASPSLARADDPKSMQDAQARFDEGIARAKQRDFEGARLAFTQAYAVLKKYDILFNLALAEEKSGHALDALTHFKQLARDTQGSADDRVTSHKHAVELASHTGHIDVAAPPGAVIVFDGSRSAGMTPLSEPLDVQPGSHKVEAHARDHTYTVTVNATAGDVVKANFLDLIPPGSVAPPSATTAPVPSDPSAPSATTTPPPDTGTPPTHESFWTPRTITVVAVGGAAVVGLGAGIFFGAKAHSDSSHADSLRATIGAQGCASSTSPNCAELASTVSSASSETTASTVFYVAGGVLAAGAIATWFLWPKSTTGTSAMVVPAVGRDGGTLNVVGRF